jgi:two-component system chemotaxis sensor kinase CheA
MDDLLQEFLMETTENLTELDVELVKLEGSPEDQDALGSIFRIFHTIKGTCGFLDLPRLERVAHAAEDVLGKFRSGDLPVTPAAVTVVLAALDRIRELIDALEASGQEPIGNDEDVVTPLHMIAEADAADAPAEPDAGQDPDPDLRSEPEDLPEADGPLMSDGGFPVAAELLEELAGFEHADAAAAVAMEPAPAAGEADATARAPEPRPRCERVGEANKAEPAAADAEARTETARKQGGTMQTIRVHVDVLEQLMTLVSELVLTRNQISQRLRDSANVDFAEPFQQLSLITADLQEGVMKTRMQPIGNAWSKLPRLVRDLCQDTGKKIDLRMDGEETELDRQVLEMIRDPLTHMIRNSADHGIESPQARRAAGKPETGTITLSACHESGHIIVTLADDGRGLNAESIARKALENGLTTASDLERLSAQQIHQFIFKPGFSTAEAVTSVSGRGVGMDVVLTNVERIGGTVELRSQPGQGTTFTVKIPLTLGVVAALIVGCGGQRYAVPQVSVRELVRVSPGSKTVEVINDAPVLRLRDRLLPLIRLRSLLRMEAAEDQPQRSYFVVVTQVGSRDFGVVVDEVFDTEEIVIKPVARTLRKIPFYSGNTILGDGRVVMILDPNGIAETLGENRIAAAPARAARTRQESERKTSFILFRAGGEDPKAVPMSLVARVEMIPLSAIERADGRVIVQYRGSMMPLVSVGDAALPHGVESFPVLVFSDRERGRTVGLVADEIIDIVEAIPHVELRAARDGVIGTAVLAGRSTDLLDIAHYLSRTNAEWYGEEEPLFGGAVQRARRLLLVAENPFLLQLTSLKLQASGFDVVTAAGGRDGLFVAEQDSAFDAVVCELDMLGMNGFDVATAMREAGLCTGVPLVALATGVPDGAMEQRARDAGYGHILPATHHHRLTERLGAILQTFSAAA